MLETIDFEAKAEKDQDEKNIRDNCNEKQGCQRRKKIWQISSGYHCSIIGACLSRKDLKQIATKKAFSLDNNSNSFAVHRVLSTIASERSPRTRALNKFLDDKYRVSIKRYLSLTGDEAVRKEWKRDLKTRGSISGAYWAIMTLPHCGQDLLDEVYGDCHMVSYDIFSSYKADSQRIFLLKGQVETLKSSLETTKSTFKKERETIRWELLELQKSKGEFLRQRLVNEHLAKENRELKEKLERGGTLFEATPLKQELESLKEENESLCARLRLESSTAKITTESLRGDLTRMKTLNRELQEELISLCIGSAGIGNFRCLS